MTPTPMAKADFISALVFLVLGVYMIVEGLRMPGAGGFIEVGGEPGKVPILLGAIFHIRWENGFFVSKGGWEWDLVMLAATLAIIVAGPGRVSISYVAKKIPRFLQ